MRLRGQTVAPAADLFAEEKERITVRLAGLDGADERRKTEQDDIAQQFEQVAEILSDIDIDQLWAAATDTERKALLDEYVTGVNVSVDHLEAKVGGAPKLNLALHEVGLRNRSVENTGVGGPTRTRTTGASRNAR